MRTCTGSARHPQGDEPETALDLARAALADCRQRGYQMAVAVVDRFGVTQVVLRRFAGRTIASATGKAWTAVSFRTNTGDLVTSTQPGIPQAAARGIPGSSFSAAAWWFRPAGRWSERSASRALQAAMPTRRVQGGHRGNQDRIDF